jgi:23S rRNA pseudouridine955/2504/2580 synthase
MQSVTIGSNQAGQRLDKFLHKYLPEAGSGFLYKMLRKKNITLNEKKATGTEILSAGDEVRFFFSEETFAKFSGRGMKEQRSEEEPDSAGKYREYERAYETLKGIGVLYEDEHVLILNKPAGILSQKAQPNDLSLNEWLIGYLLRNAPGLKRELDTFKPSVCNRLDRNTSGIVLCGKSLAGLQFLSKCIRERSVRKFYLTICVGQIARPERIQGYLVKDRAKNRVIVSQKLPQGVRSAQKKDPMGGKAHPLEDKTDYIETAYRPLCGSGSYTLLEVELVTGKTHQIRAHLAGTGHPLVGDFKYGDRAVNRQLQEQFGLEHQLLHACRVEFPGTEEPAGKAVSGRIFTAPCPEQFVRIQEEIF